MEKGNLTKKLGTVALIGTLMSPINANSAEAFGSLQAYGDSREHATLNLTAGASNLPGGLDFFGFADMDTDKEKNHELKSPYLEAGLSKKILHGLGPAVEYNRDFGSPEGTVRAGITYVPDLSKHLENTMIGMNFYPTSTNDQGSQLVFFGNKSWNNRDMYLDGFIDFNFKSDEIVSEVQFGKRIKNNLYGVIEGRYNGFQEDDFGVAIGLELKF